MFEIARDSRDWDEALSLHAAIRGGRGKRRISTYRVIARAEGERAYKRSEAGKAVEQGLRARLGKNWKVVEDDAQVEVWVTLIGPEAIIGVRLTDRSQRHRDRNTNLPASLRPTVAAAMVRLTQPQDDDVFLDPFCGTGTMLIERGEAGRHKLILGSDVSEEALNAAAANIGERHKPLELNNWDATHLPLEDGSVNAIATNPPFERNSAAPRRTSDSTPPFSPRRTGCSRPAAGSSCSHPSAGFMRREIASGRWTLTARNELLVLGKHAVIYGAIRSKENRRAHNHRSVSSAHQRRRSESTTSGPISDRRLPACPRFSNSTRGAHPTSCHSALPAAETRPGATHTQRPLQAPSAAQVGACARATGTTAPGSPVRCSPERPAGR
ncbi:MAG: methyltransferase domain-containing protein [Chloroflexia bacterium]